MISALFLCIKLITSADFLIDDFSMHTAENFQVKDIMVACSRFTNERMNK